MHWSAVLDEAAEKFDGGPRSFPAARDADMAQYAYEPPNGEYMKMFWHQATVPGSQQDASFSPHSAGLLMPTEGSGCKPVIVAHSFRSNIWLLYNILGRNALSDDGWRSLVSAAEALAQDARGEPPPSAQKPSAPPSQHASAPPQQQNKRPLPSVPAPTPKRARTDTGDTLSVSSQPSKSGEPDEPPEDPPRHRTVISNNNRRAERERSRRLALAHERKRLALGLVPPEDRAAAQEKAAYISIAQRDEPTIGWIIKQPTSDTEDFYTATKRPYFTACTLLKKAQALASQSSLCRAALFLRGWRERGSLFRSEGELAGSQARIGTVVRRLELPQAHDEVEKDFCFAYDLCIRCDTDMAAIHIESRWAAALLGQAYARRIAQIRAKDLLSSSDRSRNRYGQGKVSTQATEALMALIGLDVTEKNKRSFQRRLEIGKRWWLGPEGIAGGPISGKQTLGIEAEAPAAVYRVRARDARIRVMHAQHHNRSTRNVAIESHIVANTAQFFGGVLY